MIYKMIAPEDLQRFHRGVEEVSQLLPQGEAEQAAIGLGRIGVALAYVAEPGFRWCSRRT
jgi:hypothetical protein